MMRSTKAALLSGLVFPGIGHLVLKRYVRGAALMLAALLATAAIVTATINRALVVVNHINSGEIPIEAGAISQAIAESAIGSDGLVVNFSVIILSAVWLIGIIDSYRLGLAQENQMPK
jgi:hypothetical protein